MIRVESLVKEFSGFKAVDGLSFSLEPGEILGFLGPNGAGKSTTMKMLAGFLEPDAGRIEIYGQDMAHNAMACKALIGYLPEGAPSYSDMTVHDFLHFIAQARGLKPSLPAVESVLDRLQLGDVREKTIETLSKGFKRRVGLAQAILHDPKILILDEPTDGLDPNQKHQVRELIKNLSADKIVIVSTHILEEVSAVCNRAMIIANGRLLVDDTPEKLAGDEDLETVFRRITQGEDCA